MKKTKYRQDKHKFKFCGKKCFGKYHSEHRATKWDVKKFERSKAEKWFEEILTSRYKFNVKYNISSVVGKELDIYIPHLNIAFEINGACHYKPIFGQETLDRTMKADKEKAYRCNKKGIDLFVIDISKAEHFYKCRFEKFAREIIFIIDTTSEELGLSYYLNDGHEPFKFDHDGHPSPGKRLQNVSAALA